MRPEQKSKTLLGITRAKAKMIEYSVLDEYQEINLTTDPAKLFTLSIGILGDVAVWSDFQDMPPEKLTILYKNLYFSVRFFDSYLESKLNQNLDHYLILLASASYYLCDLPGSSKILAKKINYNAPNLGGEGLENLLLWLLQGNLTIYSASAGGPFDDYINKITQSLIGFFTEGTNADTLFETVKQLLDFIYKMGTPRQLLLGDLISAIIKKKYKNSTWYALPLYSGISEDQWIHVLQKETFIKELWPAQRLLGEFNIFKGKSAIVQMPTSAGKSKAIEIILRSAFLANRTSLAVIVAPFRALCNEIKNNLLLAFKEEAINIDELTDVFQTDFDVADLLKQKQILIVTPEKLLYVLRHNPELTTSIGLAIFDEGHQFDSGTRGITYELLLTSLRSMLPDNVQKVLLSAVISNAQAVGEWLNGTEAVIVEGKNLIPTFRSIGFASWLDRLGQIKFVSNENSEKEDFFVPRVIESYDLQKKPRERNNRVFPEKLSGKDVALYLGLKMVNNGSVAIFCGKKETVANLCSKTVDVFERGLKLTPPASFSDSKEIQKLSNLYEKHFGQEAGSTKSAKLGIFSHHGNIPHGIRLSVEYAMREDLIHFVICTSTLAQGVNLPIRYLIVTSTYQGTEQIKTRDFHNLIGRAGRAGMHTEGSILFADPIVYDKKNNWREKWRWEKVKELLDPEKSEECDSSLFKLIPPVIHNDRSKSKDGKEHSLSWDVISFATAYIKGQEELNKITADIVKKYNEDGFTEEKIKSQFEIFGQTLASIESFLISNWDTKEGQTTEEDIIRLAEETLAYFLADDENKNQIRELFKLLANNISQRVKDPEQRKIYGKTLYGIRDAEKIKEWVALNIDNLNILSSSEELLDYIWPILERHIHTSTFNKCDKPAVLKEIAKKWIHGENFYELFYFLQKADAKLLSGSQLRKFKMDQTVEICEGGLSYDGSLLINSLIEFVPLVRTEGVDNLVKKLKFLQKQLKYGLPSIEAIILYEFGFSDRVIVQELVNVLDKHNNIFTMVEEIKMKKEKLQQVINQYPSYFDNVYRNII